MQGYNTFFTFSQLSLINYKYVPIYRGNDVVLIVAHHSNSISLKTTNKILILINIITNINNKLKLVYIYIRILF